MKNHRLIIVSNRLPVNVKRMKGKLLFRASSGGLVTSLASVYKKRKSIWVGWPGAAIQDKEKAEVKKKLIALDCHPVFISEDEIEGYYRGFSNRTIWPLFHYFPQYATYEKSDWKAYVKVNKRFCDEIVKIAKPGDVFWIHDYHLMLLPGMLRKKIPKAKIGFFLHIPWPSPEIFCLLPWRKAILGGLLGSDLLAFHIEDYKQYFINSAKRILPSGVKLNLKLEALPISIDFEKFSRAPESKKVHQHKTSFKKEVGEKKVILSIDRLDYSKGIAERLEGFGLFLDKHPEWSKKVKLILIAVPSRTKVESYRLLKKKVDELIGRINGQHSTFGSFPIWYFYTSFPFDRLTALYSLGDVALVTPLRDGMNLIAKEYLATRNDETGVLILSELTGSAKELKESLIVNPNSREEIAKAIHKALTMPQKEQKKRNKVMRKTIKNWNVNVWANNFLELLEK
jgi:trehalose 6-phosphate synthase/phosphatase